MNHPRYSAGRWITIGIVMLGVSIGTPPMVLPAQDDTLELALTLTHPETVRGVSFSPDGKRIASGCGDRIVRIWNASDGKQMLALKGHRLCVTVVRFSPDGKWIASGGSDGTVRIWDAATGRQLRSIVEGTQIRDVAFSADGKRIASVSVHDRTVTVWNIASGKISFSLTGPREWQWIDSVAFSPDGKWLATGSYNGTIQLSDALTGRELRTVATRLGVFRGLAFSPDSKQLAASGSGLTLWRVDTGQQIARFTIPGNVFDVSFSPDGKRIAACTSEAHAAEWDIASGRETLSLAVHHDVPTFWVKDNHINYVYNVVYRLDGKQLATCSSDGEVRVWSVSRD